MGDNIKKQQAVSQLENIVQSVETDFQIGHIESWQQLFILYYCIISMDEDIPLELLERINKCGTEAYAKLLESTPSEQPQECAIKPGNKPNERGNQVPIFKHTLGTFFKTGEMKPQSQVLHDTLKVFGSPEYVKILVKEKMQPNAMEF